ncbi:MAG: hypothetical protein VX082_04580 [Pseudomonadota bacterium]|nr:hypothetical protein [Pseudomonadota bacterium]
MAEDVIDIRKRIEEIRNEVSTAMTDGGETVIQSRPAGELAEFSVPGVTSTASAAVKEPVQAPDPVELVKAKSGLDDALKMPSFQLNVRNQGPNKLLIFLVVTQLATNIGLMAILWHKLG